MKTLTLDEFFKKFIVGSKWSVRHYCYKKENNADYFEEYKEACTITTKRKNRKIWEDGQVVEFDLKKNGKLVGVGDISSNLLLDAKITEDDDEKIQVKWGDPIYRIEEYKKV